MSTTNNTLTLHGSDRSTCSQKVKVVAYEKDLDIHVRAVDFSVAEHKSPAFLEKQPFGQVPYLEDNGFFLYESRAISRYLAQKYAGQGNKLMPDPTDLQGMALFEQAASVEMSDFDPSAGGIAIQKIFGPMRGIQPDEAIVQKHHETLKAKLEGYERILSKSMYLTGNELSAVDLFHLPFGTMVEKVYPGFFDDASKPNVAKWWKAVSTRPSWKRVMLEAA